MLNGVICDYLSQLCALSKQLAVNVNHTQSMLTFSNNAILWMILSGLLISLLATLAFLSIVKTEMISGYSGLFIIFTTVGLLVLQSSELAYLVIVKFISISVMATFGDCEFDDFARFGILACAGLLLLIANTRFHGQAFPAVVADVVVATGGLVVLRAVRYLPSLIPFIVLGVITIVLHSHGMGSDVLTEFTENFVAAVFH